MDHYQTIQLTIDTIEEHLTEPISIRELASRAGYSHWHFQRLFLALVGETTGAYIRRRRLAAAAIALHTSRRRILDIALEFQFESQESFTRSFKAAFGLTPGQVRRARIPVSCDPKAHLKRHAAITERETMETIIKQLESRTIVGVEAPFISGLSAEKTNLTVIPEIWNAFNQRHDQLRQRVGTATFGVISCKASELDEREDDLLYLAGAEVCGEDSLPAGMVTRRIPAGLYAVFTHKGPVSAIDDSLRYVYATWLPASPYERGNGPEFEIYDERFKGEQPDSAFEFAIPIVEKAPRQDAMLEQGDERQSKSSQTMSLHRQ